MTSMIKRLAALAECGKEYHAWYDDAREFIITECDKRGWDHDVFVNVMAVTSPRISVKRNWDVTMDLMQDIDLIDKLGLIQSTRVAVRHYLHTGEIRGPKTSAFARALHGDTTALVLDTWMARALEVPHAKVTNRAHMVYALTLMQGVAQQVGHSVRDTQAMVWAGTCKIHGVQPGDLETAVLRSSQMSMEF